MLRSHRILCSCVPAPFFVFLRHTTLSHFHLHDWCSPPARCFPHARSHFRTPARCSHDYLISACPLAASRTPTPARIPAARSLFPARPLHCRTPARCFPHAHACLHFHCALAVSRHDRSLFPARPFAALPLAVSRAPRLAASHFLLRLALPLRLTLPSASRSPPPRAHLHLASPGFASPAKPSQAPNAIKTGYRMSRVWIWSSKNGRQGGV
ncbi:hypothetical protein B0H13DRAFT_2515402 [Mycena leptocephala]|nr:hypothetical protein B0H13DRAFT_2515402 [Mycena leptocephala]